MISFKMKSTTQNKITVLLSNGTNRHYEKIVNENIPSKSWDIFYQKQNTNEVFQSEKKNDVREIQR